MSLRLELGLLGLPLFYYAGGALIAQPYIATCLGRYSLDHRVGRGGARSYGSQIEPDTTVDPEKARQPKPDIQTHSLSPQACSLPHCTHVDSW